MSKCEFCDTIMIQGERNCPGCGAAASTWSEVASSSSPTVVHHHHHTSGTQEVGLTQEVGVSPKNRLVAGILGLFLGGLGIHNFYLGYTGRGITQLILIWIPGINFIIALWVLLEVIHIFAGKPKDAKGLPLVY